MPRACDAYPFAMPPSWCAERVLPAVLRNDAMIIVPGWWKASWYLERLSPALTLRVSKLLLKELRKVEAASAH